jgi:ABC-2 type transport system permease protein
VSAPAPWGRAIRAQSATELRLTARRGENLLAVAVIPAAVLIFFSTTTVVALPGGSSVEALLPGVLALAIIATGLVNLGIATAYERSYGVLKRLGGSPLGTAGLVGAKLIAVAAIVIVQVASLLAVAFLLGWRPPDGLSPLLVLAALALGMVTFTALGLLLAGTLRAEAVLALANGLFLVALLFGGILVPTTDLPPVIGAIAAVLPAAALTELLRVGLGATGSGEALPAVAVLIGWGAIAVVAAIRWFRWD